MKWVALALILFIAITLCGFVPLLVASSLGRVTDSYVISALASIISFWAGCFAAMGLIDAVLDWVPGYYDDRG